MPVIKDPVHNHKEGRYGVVWEEKEEVLAVYDKETFPDTRKLPEGWEVKGTLKALEEPLIWCNIPIKWELEVSDPNPPGQGPVSGDLKPVCDANAFLKKPKGPNNLVDPKKGVIYPL